MTIPLEQGFTVVTGPNGSGKSNILDGVLFCLGLATSRGMRADRLPDLVNSGVLRDGKSAETVVSVRFDLSEWEADPAEDGLELPAEGPWIKPGQKEWTVTRRLRIMPGGSYSSSYSADGEPCNLQQLQTQLRRLRVDPEGSNVVMQGDVTRIVSMSNKDRRGLIDELAGVALFDSRIEQTRTKLNNVQESEDRCRIVEQELLSARQRLEKDCEKARKYKDFREQLQIGKQQEMVLAFETADKGLQDLRTKNNQLAEKEVEDTENLTKAEALLGQAASQLKILQDEVKALGEDKLLAVQAEIAKTETQARELERQAGQHQHEGENLQKLRQDLSQKRQDLYLESQNQEKDPKKELLAVAEKNCVEAEAAVEVSRRRLGDVAGLSSAWLEDQKQRSAERQDLQTLLRPLQEEQQKLQERLFQDGLRQNELKVEQDRDTAENQQVHEQLNHLEKEWQGLLKEIKQAKEDIERNTGDYSIQDRTQKRLELEKSQLEREIARIESRREALQESRGTRALKLLLEAGLDGIHGAVAQLGEVHEEHRLALEVAAGARLSHVVVDNDRIAAKAIEILKNQRAGRLTFLPLNKIQSNKGINRSALQRGHSPKGAEKEQGQIARAIDLVEFEAIYTDVFAYVFGETLVFTDLNSARLQLGRNRLVTLDGELLEKSGAMTGGSFSGRSNGLSFGINNENDESAPLRKRLLEIGEALVSSKQKKAQKNKLLENARPLLRRLEQRQAALEAERNTARRLNSPLIERHNARSKKLSSLEQTNKIDQNRLLEINQELKPLILKLEKLEKEERLLHKDGDVESWKQLQTDLEISDSKLILARKNRDELLSEQRQRQLSLERLQDQQNSLLVEEERLKLAVENLASAHRERRQQQKSLNIKSQDLQRQQEDLQTKFGNQRRARDEAEAKVADYRQKLQEAQWNLERLKENRQSLAEEIRNGNIRLQELKQALPNPLPNIPEKVREAGLDELQKDLQRIQNNMESLEPVNMLALEELEELNLRLGDLGQKLDVLCEERAELLLRIENVGTLRQEAFMEAFEAVDIHFREIFASLSEGDGHLQLDNPENPLEGGLTLVAHPKGKTVRRLAAMSGGEKSLTALSFLFALQRFRPSPFYALDEVDSFLDGVNVERLSALIAQQANEAQFLVVSHRRPMIGASGRTIGVTQARGAHTQVVGLPDAA